MSKLKFDGSKHQISLIDRNGVTVGIWIAYNNVDSHATLRHIPNGNYIILDRHIPHYHVPSATGPYGLYGIIRFTVPGHPGIGIHSGRANARHMPGPAHPTMGCIRTSDEAMKAIRDFMRRDMLTSIEIDHNNGISSRSASMHHRHASVGGRLHG